MTYTSIHQVKSLELSDRRYHGKSSAPFWSREITVTDEKGNIHTLALFASAKEDLDALRDKVWDEHASGLDGSPDEQENDE